MILSCVPGSWRPATAPLQLAGIVLSGQVGYAYVNGMRLRVGDEYRGYRLARIAHNHVEMTNGTERFNLWLNAAAPAAATTASGSPADQRSYIKIVTERRTEPAGGATAAPASVVVSPSPPVDAPEAVPGATAKTAHAPAGAGSDSSGTPGGPSIEMEADDPTSLGR